MALKRIQKEHKELIENPQPNFSAGSIFENNLFKWRAAIMGPERTRSTKVVCSSSTSNFQRITHSSRPNSSSWLKFTTLSSVLVVVIRLV